MTISTRENSKVTQWREAGGRLGAAYKQRLEKLDLFPYVTEGKKPQIRIFAVLIVLMIFAFVGVYGRILHKTLSKGLDGGQRDTPSFMRQPTPTPTPTLAAAPVQVLESYPSVGQNSGSTFFVQVSPFPTSTPLPTETPIPTFTPIPSLTPLPGVKGEALPVRVRVAWFYPPLGGANCPIGVSTCEKDPLLDGSAWMLSLGKVAACPEEYPIGSWVVADPLGAWRCAHHLPLAKCNYENLICDILVLSNEPVTDDWTMPWSGELYTR